jgi:peptide-methionine (S)-S-oxide reductase|tara:strand:- start:44 stop:508 length:465 start_codon:yes stop_codon:yes gene_type:complete
MKIEKTIFAAGCFWHIEDYFSKIKGVLSTRVGYTGGSFENPTYKDICTGTTGHAEAVEIEFDAKIIPFSELLKHFWEIHDPCSLNRQGPDIGNQYRSAIFVTSSEQEEEVLKQKKLYNEKKYNYKIVTNIEILSKFYPAEKYHQKYIQKKSRFY